MTHPSHALPLLTLALLLGLGAPLRAADGSAQLQALTGLISVRDLPEGFRETQRYAAPQYRSGSLTYQRGAEEIRVLMLDAGVADERSWFQETITALQQPRFNLKRLNLGDGALVYRVTRQTKGAVTSRGVRLSVWFTTERNLAAAHQTVESLVRLLYARYTGAHEGSSSIREAQEPPVVTRITFSPKDPTRDDTLVLTAHFKDPNGDPLTVRWWYETEGGTKQKQDFEVPGGTTTHTFTWPGRMDREQLEVQVYVYDPTDRKAGRTGIVPVEQPVARIGAIKGTVTITHIHGRLANRTRNLYRGDRVNVGGAPGGPAMVHSARIEWPRQQVQGEVRWDGLHQSADSWNGYITIGSTRKASGFPADPADILFDWGIDKAKGKGLDLVLAKPLSAALNIWGWLDFTAGRAGSTGLVLLKLKSEVLIRSREDGTVDVLTAEGAPELLSNQGRDRTVVPAGQRTTISARGQVAGPRSFDPSSIADRFTGLRGSRRTSSGSGTSSKQREAGPIRFEKVWIEADALGQEGRGLWVRSQLHIAGRKGLPTRLSAFFRDASGAFLEDTNTSYHNHEGFVSAWMNLEVNHEKAMWSRVGLFIPYHELHLSPGRHDLTVQLQISDAKRNENLLIHDPHAFTVEIPRVTSTIKKVWMEHGTIGSSGEGMTIHGTFTVRGRKGQEVQARAYFHDQAGNRLIGSEGPYLATDGQVALHRTVTANYDDCTWNDLELYMPTVWLRRSMGSRYELAFTLSIWSGDTKLAETEPIPFNLDLTGSPPLGLIRDIRTQHNHVQDGVKGMLITCNPEALNCPGRTLWIGAYFSFTDGTTLRDTNGLYGTTDSGEVAVGSALQSIHQGSIWEDFTLFMPYSELHLAAGKHSLQYHLGLYEEGGAGLLARSDPVTFTCTQD